VRVRVRGWRRGVSGRGFGVRTVEVEQILASSTLGLDSFPQSSSPGSPNLTSPARKHRFLRWVVIIAFGVPALLMGLFIAAFMIGSYRLERELGFWVQVNLPAGFSGCTDLRFDLPGAPPTRAEGAIYIVDLPPDGRWHSSTKLNWGETLAFAFYFPTPEGYRRVEPNRGSGATTTHHDGSVDPGSACFEQPLKWAKGKGPGPLP
jgi:hypothetical protein